MGVAGSVPGVGGINRGRADAELTWGEESEGQSELFTPEALRAAELLDQENIGLIGLSATTPEAKPEHDAAGAEGVEGARGSTAWRRKLSPRHRRAVRGFFAPAGEANAGDTKTKEDE